MNIKLLTAATLLSEITPPCSLEAADFAPRRRIAPAIDGACSDRWLTASSAIPVLSATSVRVKAISLLILT